MNNLNKQNPSPEKKQVEVKIGNIKYNLTTTESEEYINGIAKYINNKIDELSVSHQNINKDSIPFFLTMALNIADDLFKQRKQFTKSSKSLKTLEENLSKINQNTLSVESLKAIIEEKDLEISSLKDNFSNTLKEKEQKIQELSSLKDDFSNALKEKEQKIQELSSLKDDFSNALKEKEQKIQELSSLKDDFSNKLKTKDEEISSLNEIISSLNETVFSLNETVSSLEKKSKELSSIEDESLNLLYEKEKEIENLNKKIKELSYRLNVSKEF